MMKREGDPDHPIIDAPWEYEIVGFIFERSLFDEFESYIDLKIQREGVVRNLRFLSPQNLTIDSGFPSSEGLSILDVSSRQMQGINIWVYNYENSGGCPQFWARDVIDLDQVDNNR